MRYKEAINYLYSATPRFEYIGAAAYKPGLDTVKKLSLLLGDNHRRYPVIHVAGTNGKGSTSHTISAILQCAGYNVGLFTSPHLYDFRERIRVNGEIISKREVSSWLKHYLELNSDLQPSFFELTTVMAFDLFAKRQVDVAVVEVGLGGRLDSTNIVYPVLSVITNVSMDHVAQLGDTLSSIASEKAGIIKPRVPVVLGEGDVSDVRTVIEKVAHDNASPLSVASDFDWNNVESDLKGNFQKKNRSTVLAAIEQLRMQGWKIYDENIKYGFANVEKLTGLTGRWKLLDSRYNLIADTGHNEGAWNYLPKMIDSFKGTKRLIIGFVKDKDVDKILSMMPKNAVYYFTQASIPRALPASELKIMAERYGLSGNTYDTVNNALRHAKKDAGADSPDSLIFVGGSTYVVAEIRKNT